MKVRTVSFEIAHFAAAFLFSRTLTLASLPLCFGENCRCVHFYENGNFGD